MSCHALSPELSHEGWIGSSGEVVMFDIKDEQAKWAVQCDNERCWEPWAENALKKKPGALKRASES